jgi:hypothetical protein
MSMAARHPPKIPTLDKALDLCQTSVLALSRVIQKESRALKQGDYELPTLIQMSATQARTMSALSELAPLLELRLHIEPIERVIEWLLDSGEYTGEFRADMIDALKTYQEQVLEKTGHYQPRSNQMRLL